MRKFKDIISFGIKYLLFVVASIYIIYSSFGYKDTYDHDTYLVLLIVGILFLFISIGSVVYGIYEKIKK